MTSDPNKDIHISIVSAAGIMAAERERTYVTHAVETFEDVLNEGKKYSDIQIVDSAMAYLNRTISIQRLPDKEHEPIDCWLGAIGISSDFDVFATTAIYIALKTNPGLVSSMEKAHAIVIFPCKVDGQVLVAVMPCENQDDYDQVVKIASTAMNEEGSKTLH